jgi:plastocyanin
MSELRSLRLRPFSSSTLDRNTYQKGEVFFDVDNFTLRIFAGDGDFGGIELLRSDLANINGVLGAAISDTPPPGAKSGTIWLNSSNGKLYIYDVSQWVQPVFPAYAGGGGTSAGATTLSQLTDILISSPANGQVLQYSNGVWVNGTVSGGSTYTLPTASTSVLGGVRVDGTTITITGGVISGANTYSLPTASTSVLGGVKVDGTTITISNGVITAVGGGGGGGSGTVNAGVAGSLAYYPSNGTVVDDNASLTWGSSILTVTGAVQATGSNSIIRSIYADAATLGGAVSATTYSGAMAYVSNPGRVYVANGTSWNPLANLADLPSTFANVLVAGQSTVTAGNSADSLTLAAGSNVTLTTNGKTVTIAATSTSTNSYNTIAVSGQTNLTAATSSSTLTLTAGPNITITTNSGSNSITISGTSGGQSAGGVSAGTANRLTYYASTGSIVQDTGAGLTWSGTVLGVTGTVSATTFSGSGASLSSIPNSALTNSSITVTAGTGMTGGGSVALGGTVTLTNNGVTSLTASTGVSVSGASGAVTISNSGVTKIVAGTNISISSTGANGTGEVTINDTFSGITSVVAGTGYITTSTTSGVATINNTMDKLYKLADADKVIFNGTYLTIDKVAMSAATMFSVIANGILAYRFESHHSTTNNPTLYVLSGTTIAFNLQVPGHPFVLQTTGGVNLDPSTNTALGTFFHVAIDGTVSTGTAAQAKITGTLYWIIGPSAAGTYRYQCTLHSAMVGNIVVKSITSLA